MEGRAASRAEMRQSMTVPNNLNEVHERSEPVHERKPSYSRHYEYDYNGHRIQPESGFKSNLKHTNSLSLLPLARDANSLNFRDKYNRPGSDWNLTTTKRAFRYVFFIFICFHFRKTYLRFSEEGFKNARAKPYRPLPSLKIAVEGKRYLAPEKKDVFVRFADNRPFRSAKPDGRPTPPMPNPLFGHAPQHTQYDAEKQEAGYGRADTGYHKEPMLKHPEMNRRRESLSAMPDTRFSQGTTNQSTFREPPNRKVYFGGISDLWRPKGML